MLRCHFKDAKDSQFLMFKRIISSIKRVFHKFLMFKRIISSIKRVFHKVCNLWDIPLAGTISSRGTHKCNIFDDLKTLLVHKF